jgi:ankyrin repeat protein
MDQEQNSLLSLLVQLQHDNGLDRHSDSACPEQLSDDTLPRSGELEETREGFEHQFQGVLGVEKIPQSKIPVGRGKQGATELYNAVLYNMVDQVKLLLEKNPNLIFSNRWGYTLLHQAASQNPAIMKLLLECDIEVNTMDESGCTPLQLAVYSRSPNVKLLLAKKANPDIRDRKGYTTLHIAVMNGDVGTLSCLLDFGATTDIRDNKGDTPLDLACRQGQFRMVKLLLGTKLFRKFKKGEKQTA